MPFIVRMAALPFFTRLLLKLFFGRWAIKWNMKKVFYHADRVTDEKIDAYYERMCTHGALDAQISVARSLDFGVFEKGHVSPSVIGAKVNDQIKMLPA